MVVPLESSAFLLNGPIIKNATSAIITTTSTAMMPISRALLFLGAAGAPACGAAVGMGCCGAEPAGVAPLLRRANFRLGSGRGLMGGLYGHVRLRILLRLRGLAIIGYRRSAAGAKTLVVIQKLAAMGTKPGHDGSFHSMCWLDYKVDQVRLGRRRPNWLCEDNRAAQALSHASQ